MSRATCRARNGPSSKRGWLHPPNSPPKWRWNAACGAASPAPRAAAGSTRGMTQPRRPDRRWRVALAASLLASVGDRLERVGAARAVDPATTAHALHHQRLPIITTRIVRLGSVRGLEHGSPDLTLSRAEAPVDLVIEPDVVVLTCEDGAIELECPGGTAPQTPQYPEYEIEIRRSPRCRRSPGVRRARRRWRVRSCLSRCAIPAISRRVITT